MIKTIIDSILNLYKTWPTAQGIIENIPNECTEMIFYIEDQKVKGNEFRVNLAFHHDGLHFSGNVSYWMENQDIADEDIIFHFSDLNMLHTIKEIERFSSETLVELKTSVFDFVRTIIFTSNKVDEELLCKVIKERSHRDWCVWQYNDDYIDLEAEFTTAEETKTTCRKSINMHVTFSPDLQNSYVMLGTNEGDGFNDIEEFDGDFETTIGKIQCDKTKVLFKENKDSCINLIEQGNKIIKQIPWSLFA